MFNFKPTTKIYSDDLHYDLFIGGCIEPSDLLTDSDQIKKVNKARDIINQYLSQLEENDIVGEK